MARNGNAKTRRFALNMLKAGVAISGAALLFACGDDSSSGAEGSQTATGVDSTVESIDDLLNCTSKHEGETAYIKEEKATYVCVDGDWITGSISESIDDLLNCTPKHEGETVFVKEDKKIYVCTDGDWVVVGETGNEGDNEGDDADKKSSSSTAKSADSKAKSSSSLESSSSVIPGSDPESSSSEGVGDASSSSVIASSSSEEQAGSSSSDELSSSSRGFFDMTKDEFLNPKISYGEMTDSRDNQVYKTVEICNNETSTCQTWMAENLNYSVNPNVQSGCGGGRDYTEGDCSVYGRLYTWAAAVGKSEDECGYGKTCNLLSGDIRGVCPEGWHLPSNVEWNALFTAVGGTRYAGQKLKAESDLWTHKNGVSNDDSFGFAVLPAGYRSSNGYIYGEGGYAHFWSSTEYSYGALGWDFDYSIDHVDDDWNFVSYGFSVRCLRDSN